MLHFQLGKDAKISLIGLVPKKNKPGKWRLITDWMTKYPQDAHLRLKFHMWQDMCIKFLHRPLVFQYTSILVKETFKMHTGISQCTQMTKDESV